MKNCTPCAGSVNPKNCEPCEILYADHVIVGAGTAGCALAWGLSNNKCLEVFVIEAGTDNSESPDVLTVPAPPEMAVNQKYHHTYPVVLSAVDGFTAYTQMGRGWGGSSMHNFFVAVRGTPYPYNLWASQTGDNRWTYNNLLPYMIALETYTSVISGVVNPAQRGTEGPLFITEFTGGEPLDPIGNLAAALGASPAGGGAPFSVDYNDPSLGWWVVGNTQNYVNPDTFERSWSGSAFLGPNVVARQDNGDGLGVNGRLLRVSSGSSAFLLLVDRGIPRNGKYTQTPHVYGVRFYKNGAVYEVRARKKVHLAGGAFEDAMLLQRSGIGDKDYLESLGIVSVLDNANVGANLQNHYGTPTVFLPLPDPADATLPAGLTLFQGFFDLRGNNVGAGTNRREFQVIAGANNPGPAPANGSLFMFPINLRPQSLGSVKINDAAWPSSPQIELNMWSNPDDLARAVQMLKVVANISLAWSGDMPTVPPADVYPAPYPGGLAADDSELEAFAMSDDSHIFTNHYSGTARMSADKTTGVVNSKLDVHGMTGISVVSNAAVPVIEDGNTAYQAYVLGLVKAEIEGGKVL